MVPYQEAAKMDVAGELKNFLNQHLSQLAELKALLEREQSQLKLAKPIELDDITIEKNALLQQIESRATELHSILQPTGAQTIQAWIEKNNPDKSLVDLHQQWQQLMRDIKDMNDVNGTVIRLSLMQNRRLHQLIAGKPDETITYNADGQMK
jgi:flagellar biosynthesis/type III secretory pathway chaperone